MTAVAYPGFPSNCYSDPYTRKLLSSEPDPLTSEAPERTTTLLKGENIRVTFPIRGGWLQRKVGEVKAVDGVSLELREGETIGIVGESGSGKTTLGLALFRLLDAKGRVVFEGRDLTGLSERDIRPQRRFFQIIFQDPFSSLSPRMTIEEIVGEGLRVHAADMSKAQRRDKVLAVLREVGMSEDMLWRYPHEFSGGQRQRIAIARAIVLEPKVVLLDEPTSSLDVSVQKQVLDLLRNLQQAHQLSYLFITHDLRVIRAMAHRICVLRDGKIVEQGDTDTLFRAPQEAYTRELLSASLLRPILKISLRQAPGNHKLNWDK